MKTTHYCLICTTLLVAFSDAVEAAEISIDATTINSMEKRDVNGSGTENIMPVTQFLGLEVQKFSDANLSLHFYGWGRADLGDKSYNNDRTSGSLTYGYLQYRHKEANANVRAGRFFVHEGIVNEHVDGVSARTELPYGLGLSVFGGATVHTRNLYGESSDGKGDMLYGGRANYRFKGLLELGLSGIYEGKAPTLVNYSNGNHRLLGADIWFTPFTMVELMGHSSYNPETGTIAEHTYLLNFKPTKDLTLSTDFNEHRQKSYLYAWSMFSGAAMNPNEKSRSVGGKASYRISGKAVEVTADYKHYTRDRGNADRYGADLRFNFLENNLRNGISYHFLRAGSGFAIGTNPNASFHELRAYTLYDSKTCFAAIDIIDYIFVDKVYGEKMAWEGTLSLGYHITPSLALSGDFSYGRNPQFREEGKGLIRLTYNMTFNSKGGKK